MTGSDFGSAFKGLAIFCYASLLIVPLGVWKLVEIIIWLCRHIVVHVK